MYGHNDDNFNQFEFIKGRAIYRKNDKLMITIVMIKLIKIKMTVMMLIMMIININ